MMPDSKFQHGAWTGYAWPRATARTGYRDWKASMSRGGYRDEIGFTVVRESEDDVLEAAKIIADAIDTLGMVFEAPADILWRTQGAAK